MDAIVQFSGGKDSLACLHLAKAAGLDVVAYFADSGAMYPHLVEFVHETCRRLDVPLRVISPDSPVRDWIDARGHPSDIIPAETTAGLAPYLTDKPGALLQDMLSCCWRNLLEPLNRAVIASGMKTVMRGSKACDARVGVPDGFRDEHGIAYLSPLWDWDDARVYAYLAEHGVPLPRHYPEVPDSTTCTICTADLWHGGVERLRWTRREYPELWPELEARMAIVEGAVRSQVGKWEAALAAAREDR